MAVSSNDDFTSKTYCIKCRLCRTQLVLSDKVIFSHKGSTQSCGNCVFLDEDCLPCWINDEIERSSWTKGRLKCPKVECTARVGGFDFIQGLLCRCEEFVIPAIWLQGVKVDVQVVDESQKKDNLSKESKQLLKIDSKNLNHNKYQATYQTEDASIHVSRVLPLQDENKVVRTSCCPQSTSSYCRVTMKRSHHGVIEKSKTTDITCALNGGRSTYTDDCPKHSRLKNKPTLKTSRHCRKKERCQEYLEQCTSQHILNETDFHMDMKQTNRFGPLAVPEATKKFELVDHSYDVTDREDLICPICLDYYVEPYKCPCQHMFCDPCLRQLYHRRTGTLRCPICRGPVTYVEVAQSTRQEINSLQIPSVQQRRLLTNTKYRKWPLPPLGSPILKGHKILAQKLNQNLLILFSSLFIFCIFVYLYEHVQNIL